MCRRLSSVGRIRVPRRRSSINKVEEKKKLVNWICFVVFLIFIRTLVQVDHYPHCSAIGVHHTQHKHNTRWHSTTKSFEVVVIWCEISFAPNWQIKMEWQLTNHDQTHSKKTNYVQKHEFFMSLSQKNWYIWSEYSKDTHSNPNFGMKQKTVFPYSLVRH